jgi:hypothetical protein
MSTNAKLASQTLNGSSRLVNVVMLIIWIVAAVSVMLPFAVGTSPLDALLLKVPGDQGNWFHVLIGLPFFLSLPMIWLRLRMLKSVQLLSISLRRILWFIIIFSGLGTLLVEGPFLLHLAGTSELQRLEVIFSGIGMILISGISLYVKRKKIHPITACIIGLTAAYLANAFLCLIVYGEPEFYNQPRSGWYITLVIVFPMLIEFVWLLFKKSDA